jgi:transposase-like protein
MVLEPVLCPACQSSDIVKHGQSGEGKQRYKCRNSTCARSTFILHYAYRGYLPAVKQQIVDMALNGSGIAFGKAYAYVTQPESSTLARPL